MDFSITSFIILRIEHFASLSHKNEPLNTMSCLNEQQHVSLETNNTNATITPNTFPLSPKSSEFLYGSKGYLSRATPAYLNKVMNSSLSVRSAFLQDCERRRKNKGVSFGKSSAEKEVDYGYGDMGMDTGMSVRSAYVKDCEKRRKTNKGVRFESSASPTDEQQEVDYGYGVDIVPPPTKKRRMQRRNSKTPQMLMAMNASLATLDFLNDPDDNLFSTESKDESFDGGLKIAEDLVKHLQTRRRRPALKP